MMKIGHKDRPDAMIMLTGINSNGVRNATLQFELKLQSPLDDAAVYAFRKAFKRTFGLEHIAFECEATFLPLGISFHSTHSESLIAYCNGKLCVECDRHVAGCWPRNLFVSQCRLLYRKGLKGEKNERK